MATLSTLPRPAAGSGRWRARARALLAAAALTLPLACAPATGIDGSGTLHLRPEPHDGVLVLRIPATGVGRTVAVRHSLLSTMVIPRGHVPPPGVCRIWHFGRSPSAQPPFGACPELERSVPAGAYLIYG